jgi:hypothetical protein
MLMGELDFADNFPRNNANRSLYSGGENWYYQ